MPSTIDSRDNNAPWNEKELDPHDEQEVSRNKLYLELKEIWKFSKEFENTYFTNRLKKLMDKF
jgi:hypothetical protein